MYDVPSSYGDGIYDYDESGGFNGPIWQYDWKLLGKKEVLIPYNCNKMFTGSGPALNKENYFDPEYTRWELHRCWVVEATLHPGDRNTTARRMCYIDEDTWTLLLSDMYGADGNMVKTAVVYNHTIPSLPCTWEYAEAFWDIATGDYNVIGSMRVSPYSNNEYLSPQSPEIFDPQQMAASASF